MKKLLFLIGVTIALAISISACIIKIPLRVDPIRPVMSKSISDLTDLDMRRLNGLGMMLALWEKQFEMGFSSSAEPYLDSISQLSGIFGYTIDVEKMKQIGDLETARDFSQRGCVPMKC